MCGIVGFIGEKNAVEPVLCGLRNLEYRGYDSAGVAFYDGSKIRNVKQAGRVAALENELVDIDIMNAKTAIGHTRWATHGTPTKSNAHPHYNKDKTIFVVHNGIIENHQEIRAMLETKGYLFVSQTDTEVIPHLIDYFYNKSKNIEQSFTDAISELKGAYAIVMMSEIEPDKIFAAKLSSPLAIGVGKKNNMVGSDASAVADASKKIVYLEDFEMAIVEKNKYKIRNLKNKKAVNRNPEDILLDDVQASKGPFEHFMLKEIHEAPKTIQNAILGRIKIETDEIKLGGLDSVVNQLRNIDRIIIVSCGTSYIAGLVGEYLIEELADIPVEVQLASEFKYRKEPYSPNTAILAISQSGETADTIAALKKVEPQGLLTLGIVNSPGSTISRMTKAGIYCHAGPEISVASTKAFTAQVTILVLLALWLGKKRSKLYKDLLLELSGLPKTAEKILSLSSVIKEIAIRYSHHRDFMFIGRGYEYPVALEGSLKLKEISYIHAEAYAGGELKHGPLALIDENFPTLALASSPTLFDKTASNIQEIKARGGKTIVVTTKKQRRHFKNISDDLIIIPEVSDQLSPILEAIVVQLFSYYIANEKGCDIDKPRNLAKSVTVE